MSEDDSSWKKISSTLRESIMEKCKSTNNWDDIAKPVYESLIVNFKDATEMSPKFPMERRKEVNMWEEITSLISQSKIVEIKDIKRRDDEVEKLFKSLVDVAEVLFKNIKENDSRNEILETLFKSLNDTVESLLISLNKNCKDSKSWDDNIAEKLRKRLLGQRYLIVLDDIWSTNAWDELSSAFDPSNTQGSRIILTSREYDVGKYARSGAEPHCLRFLDAKERTKLLQSRLSKENVRHPELMKFGIKIAEKCGGVALVVVLVAGILQKKIEEKDFSGQDFLQGLSSHIRGDESRSMDVIGLSYKNLPKHLRRCLLYFGAFPEDYEIPVSKLIQLWMAEGFVNQIEMKRLEDEAEDYLDHLIGSNLIMVSTREYNDRVRTCRVHDLVGSFCMTKAKEKKFLVQMDSEHTEMASANYDRFCLHKRNDNDLSPDSAMSLNPSLKTLLCFSSHNVGAFSWVPNTFKCVRVLDLDSIVVGQSFFKEVESLVCLRYLAVFINGRYLSKPPSLERLCHLETLKVKSNPYFHFPFMLWNLESLRHLHIDHYCGGCGNSRIPNPPKKPLNLQTLSIPILKGSFIEERLLKKLPHLRKLRCRLQQGDCNKFPTLEFLHQLESLEVCHNNLFHYPHPAEFKFPNGLKQLVLHNFRLPWDCISTIAQLPHLESLELFSAFEGEQWDVVAADDDEGNFCKLKFLRISESIMVRWNATADSFPKLERLVLTKIRCLLEVPSAFQDIVTLQEIEIDQCNTYVARSAEKIQEAKEELGYKLNLTIKSNLPLATYSSQLGNARFLKPLHHKHT